MLHMLHKSVLVLCAATCLAACVSTPSAPALAAKTAGVRPPPGCVASNGWMLSNPSKCGAFGNTYTRDDLHRYGDTTTGSALSTLDPTLNIRGP